MRIPQDAVDRIRSSVDIVALIGEHVKLTKAGRSFKGLCPFHQEKTPSFMVNPERQAYHCFGCQAGGNAITFLMEYAKMSFPEAVRHLAERSGIPVPAAGDDPGREMETTRLFEALAFAAGFFQERYHHPYAGKPARDYAARRGLDPEMAELFGLGFAPGGWRDLAGAARKRFTLDVLVKAGLLIPREEGDAYDRFRNRLIVPVQNPMGRIVGFGGRALGDEEPKYINSPESPVYQKGQILFGLPQAREALSREDRGILVEGYLDQLRVFGAGLRNVVAVAGTAFTPHQAALLKRYVASVHLVFDGDAAGITAAWRAAGPCAAQGLDVRIAVLPEGHDPDSLIRDEGVEAFRTALSGAVDVVDFAATRIARTGGREEALRRLVELIRESPDAIRRRLLTQSAAERLRFDEATLVKLIESGRPATEFRPGPAAAPAAPAADVIDPVERTLMALVLGEPELAGALNGLEERDFRDPLCRELYARIQSAPAGSVSVDRLLESEAGSPLARLVSQMVVESAGGGPKAAADCAERLRKRRIDALIAGLNEQLKEAERAGDAQRVQEILMELRKTSESRSTLSTGVKS